MSLRKSIESLFESLEEGIREVGEESRKAAKGTESLADALERQSESNQVLLKNSKATSKALVEVGVHLLAIGAAQYKSGKSWHDMARMSVRGSSLLGKTADDNQKTVRSLQDSAVQYKKLTGASTEESLKLVASYQANQKLLHGQLDKGADEYLEHAGRVGRMLGMAATEMAELQDTLLRKGKFSKEFSKNVTNMMLEAADRFNLSASESASTLAGVVENSFHLDQKGREEVAKRSLEAAALSKRAAVDFGKYTTSLVGASGADRLKGMYKMSATSGVDVETINKALRAKEIDPNDTQINEIALKAAKAAAERAGVKIGENGSFADAFQNANAGQQANIEEVMKQFEVVGTAMDAAAFERKKKEGGKPPKLSGKEDRDLAAKHDQIETTTEMFNRGVAWVDKWTVKADDWIHKLASVLEQFKGAASVLGITSGMLSSLLVKLLGSKMAMRLAGKAGRGAWKAGRAAWEVGRKTITKAKNLAGKAKPFADDVVMKGKNLATKGKGLAGKAATGAGELLTKGKGLAGKAIPALEKAVPMLGKGAGLAGKAAAKASPWVALAELGWAGYRLRNKESRDKVRSESDGVGMHHLALGLHDWKESADGAKSSQKALNATEAKFLKKYGTLDFTEIRKRRSMEREQSRKPTSQIKPIQDRSVSEVDRSAKEAAEANRIAKEQLAMQRRMADYLSPVAEGTLMACI